MVDRLRKKETAQRFSIELQNKFAVLEAQPDNVEDRWEQIKKAFVEAGEEVIGYRKRKNKPWITEQTEKRIEERKNLKEKRNQAKENEEIASTTKAYNAKHREVQRSFRRDKRAWAENLAKDAQEAAAQGNSNELYKITKTLANRKFTAKKPVKDKNGNPIVNEEKQMERWKEFFEELLNKQIEGGENLNEETVENRLEDPRISIGTPSKAEIVAALKEIKNGKAAGVDCITPEMLKTNPNLTADIFYGLIKEIWEKELIPDDWRKGLLIKLPKKGDTSLCNNWRGITLLSVASKILTRIILNRIKDTIDSKLRREQAGFRKDHSCVDMINTLRIIVEQCSEYQSPVYLSFVDFEKAFDSIEREAIWRSLESFGTPKETWKRSVNKEIEEEGKSWGEIKLMAQNRVRWKAFVAALRPPWENRN